MQFIDPAIFETLFEDDSEGPDDFYKNAKIGKALVEAIDSLPDREGAIIKMLFMSPDIPSYEEIVRKLKIPKSSIGPLRGRAIERLRNILKKKRLI